MARPKTLRPADFAVMTTTAVLLNVRHDLATPADQQQPPVYGPHEYGKPEHERAFEVPAERLYQALQRTRADWAADCARWHRDHELA